MKLILVVLFDQNWPYADRLSGKFEGFCVDLMNEIADIVGFEYRLYFSPDGKYGGVVDNRLNGMIGEVYNNVSYHANFIPRCKICVVSGPLL